MKIFAIMLVKNEVDIVGPVLKSAEKWADKIFILDNGSTDGTWELIQSIKDDVITPWKQDFGPFRRGMRADVFNHFRNLSTEDDWWCYALDADEFYEENPREFLKRVPKNFHWVFKKSIDYVITKEDVQNFDFTGDFEKDKSHLKYFKVPCWCEGRFFKYRKNLIWNNGAANQYPAHVGVAFPNKIIVKHYQYRSPLQMQKRLDLRNALASKKSGQAFSHIKQTDWQELLVDRNSCVFDKGNIEFYKNMPEIKIKRNYVSDFAKMILIKLGLYN